MSRSATRWVVSLHAPTALPCRGRETTRGAAGAGAARVHELALMEDLVAAVTDEIGEARVHVVRLVVGARACVSPEALRFCFDVCTRGTSLEGASLDIVEGGGDELRLREVEVT